MSASKYDCKNCPAGTYCLASGLYGIEEFIAAWNVDQNKTSDNDVRIDLSRKGKIVSAGSTVSE